MVRAAPCGAPPFSTSTTSSAGVRAGTVSTVVGAVVGSVVAPLVSVVSPLSSLLELALSTVGAAVVDHVEQHDADDHRDAR